MSIFSLISNSFTLNSGGRSPSARRAEARARGVQRRVNMEPLRINYDCLSSPGKSGVTSMSTEDLSFYPGTSPASSPRPCSTSPCDPQLGLLSPEHSPLRFTVVPADSDHRLNHHHHHQPECDITDQSSMDSGYSTNYSQDPMQKRNFRFMPPCGVPPRRIDPSPRKISTSSNASSTTSSNTSPKSSSNFRIFNSLSSGSMESIMDDDYLELFEMEALDENAQLPSDISNLISGNIMSTRTTPEIKRPVARRSLSLNENETNRAKTNLFSEHRLLPKMPEVLRPVLENLTPYSSRVDGSRSFKRPEPPTENYIQSKRYRSDDKENVMNINDVIKLPPIRKSISMNDATTIMNALAKCKFNLSIFSISLNPIKF